jgi:hypothetical protein
MAIANRMWKRAFGQGISEPVTNIDDPKQSVNPELLIHLAEEMKRVKFNLKDFMRIIYNTRAYQSEPPREDRHGRALLLPGPAASPHDR